MKGNRFDQDNNDQNREKTPEADSNDTETRGYSFDSYEIPKSLVSNLRKEGITSLFEIQARSFERIYAGKDFVGRARTGQGKTLAFVLPIASRIINDRQKDRNSFRSVRNCPLVLVLCPVRELAAQVAKVFQETCGYEMSVCTVFGGVPYAKQEHLLQKGAEVVIGTCGRVKDLLEKGMLRLDRLRFVVLDEVDEMLNIGFADDVENILSYAANNQFTKENSNTEDEEKRHQVLLFSATLPKWVDRIARRYLDASHERLDLVGDTKLQTSFTLRHFAACCVFSQRDEVLAAYLEQNVGEGDRAIIFAERKKECNDLAQGPLKRLSCRLLHGDISQADRSKTIEGFRQGKFRMLVATDVAARGINVPGVSLVVQIDPPKSHETYVHRSGRTGRAGAEGKSVLFYSPKNAVIVAEIERKAKIQFERIGAPSPVTLIKSSLEFLEEEAAAMRPSTRKLLTPYIRGFLSEDSESPKQNGVNENTKAENFLMAALIKISGGAQKFKNRSHLTGETSFVTLCVSKKENKATKTDENSEKLSKKTENGQKLVKSAKMGLRITREEVRRAVGDSLFRTFRNFTLFKDNTGAAFDIDEDLEEKIMARKEAMEKKGFQIEQREILPSLTEFSPGGRRFLGRGWNGGRNSGSRRDNCNGRAGRGNGRWGGKRDNYSKRRRYDGHDNFGTGKKRIRRN